MQYTGIVDEHRAVRTAAGLFDVSHMGELRLRGEYAAHVVDYLVTNDAKRLADGQAIYTCACNERGTILDDLIVYRRAQDDWLIVCNAVEPREDGAHFARAAEDHCDFEDESDAHRAHRAPGPAGVRRARRARRRRRPTPRRAPVVPLPRRDPRRRALHRRAHRLHGRGRRRDLLPAGTTRPRVWRALIEAGRPLGLKPVGLGARDTLRLEARLSLYGNDIDETTNPLEAGLGWVVKLDKGDFVGRAASTEIKAEAACPQARRLRDDRTRHRAARLSAPRPARAARSASARAAAPGPRLARTSASAMCRARWREVGTTLLVDCRGKNVEAVVVKTPFYKRGLTQMSEDMSRPTVGTRRTTSGRAPRGGEVPVGITAFAVEQLGDITLVNLDVKVGDAVTAGKAFGTIESVKTLSDLFAPVSGKIVRVNAELATQAGARQRGLLGKAWMIAIAPERPEGGRGAARTRRPTASF